MRKNLTVISGNFSFWSVLFLLNFVLFSQLQIFAQEVSTSAGTFRTPDIKVNESIRKGLIDFKDLFGIRQTPEGLIVNPTLQRNWKWMAAKDVSLDGKKMSFFLYDGWLYINRAVKTAFRLKKFSRDVTSLVNSNVFTIAFYSEKGIENELVIFIASEKKKLAKVIIDSDLWGEEKTITYPLKAGEGHLISIMKMAREFRPYFVEHPEAARLVRNFNDGWRFNKGDVKNAFALNFDDREWQSIKLPHTWNNLDVIDTRDVYDGYDIYHGYYRGVGWYRKGFYLDSTWQNKRIYLQFEAANQIAEVWLNEEYLGKHVGGYTGFSFDITDFLEFNRKNILAVKVDNSFNIDVPPLTADFDMYGGIYRDVWLEARPNIFLDNPLITTPVVTTDSANVSISVDIFNQSPRSERVSLKVNVANQEKEIVATLQGELKIKANQRVNFRKVSPFIEFPNLWSPENPYLYKVYFTLYLNNRPVDEIKIPLGFRWFKFDSHQGFFLNGRPLKLRGVNKHQDYLFLGNAVPDSLQVRDIQLIKKMGANFIRLAHYPQDPAVLNACDSLGLLVWEEIPVVNMVSTKKFSENAKQMLREMIRRDRNHPSIILWGLMNETLLGFVNREQIPKTIELLKELNDIAHREDPTRLTVQAHNRLVDENIAGVTDVIGRNRYFGWYSGNMEDFEKEMLDEHRRHPEWKILVSEYGAGSKRGYHVDVPKRFDFSEEYQLAFHEYYLKIINKYPWISGGAVWNAFDFASAVKRGNIPRINQKGLSDMLRRPKDVYYFYQSQWAEQPMVYIVSHTRKNLTGKAGELKKVRVFSNCQKVELFLNGTSLGVQEKGSVWKVPFVVGKNELVAVGQKNGQTVTDKITVQYELK